MNRAKLGLALCGGLLFLLLTFGGVCFLAGAAYLALAAVIAPWLAALVTALILLSPLLLILARLVWTARQRRQQSRQRQSLDGLNAIFAEKAKADPYGFVGAAFMSGMMLAGKGKLHEHIAVCVTACKDMHPQN